MSTAEHLVEIEAIRRLKARYFRCLDSKDWGGYTAVFAPDAVMNMRAEEARSGGDAEAGLVRTPKAIADYVRSHIDKVVTVHHGHTSEIDLTSPTTATGIWAMEDRLWWPGDVRFVHGYGHYHETYEKAGGQWLIKTIMLTRLRVDTLPPPR